MKYLVSVKKTCYAKKYMKSCTVKVRYIAYLEGSLKSAFLQSVGLFEPLKTGQHKHTSYTQVIQLLHVGISVSGHHCLGEYWVKASVVVSLSAVHRDSF